MWIRVFDHSNGAICSHMCEKPLMVTCARGVRSMASHTCVNQLDSQVKGDKVVRGMKGMRGEESMNISPTCVKIYHTCVSTHLGLKDD